MGGHDAHGHGPPYVVPDAKIYKVADVPQLLRIQNILASEGLKDPWLRNYVWKYDPHGPTRVPKIFFRRTIGRGMLYGFIAAVITTGIGKLIEDDHHGHGSSEHQGEHASAH